MTNGIDSTGNSMQFWRFNFFVEQNSTSINRMCIYNIMTTRKWLTFMGHPVL